MTSYKTSLGRPHRSPLCWAIDSECHHRIKNNPGNYWKIQDNSGRLEGVQDHQRNYIELKRYAIKFETSGNTFLEVALR